MATCAPTIARGVSKQVVIAPEAVCWGQPALATAGRQLRRVTADFNLTKESYQSEEIRVSQQVSDMRHGTRSVTGSISGELSAGSYSDLMEALVARDFTATAAIVDASVTIAAAGDNWSITEDAASWVGISPGMVIRLTAGAAAGNLNKNLVVLSVAGTAMIVKVLDNSALTAESATVTVSVAGKSTFAPLSGHTDKSFTVEERYTDIGQFERYVGNKVTSMSVSMPSTGLTTVEFALSGKDMDRAESTGWFTNPTAQSNTGIFAAANGVVLLGGQPIALITSADFSIERATENATVVGSNSIANIFTGRITSTGSLSLYFVDAAARTLFDKEIETSLVFTLTESNDADANVFSVVMPRVLFSSFGKQDAELGIMASVEFTALENSDTSGGFPATTVMIQDTSLV